MPAAPQGVPVRKQFLWSRATPPKRGTQSHRVLTGIFQRTAGLPEEETNRFRRPAWDAAGTPWR